MNEMATHSSTLAWRIPWMEEPGRLQSTGSQRVGHDWATSLSLSPKEGFRHIAKWFQFTFKKCNFELCNFHSLIHSIYQLSIYQYWNLFSCWYLHLKKNYGDQQRGFQAEMALNAKAQTNNTHCPHVINIAYMRE